jgi:hypothetical protein
MKKLLFVACLLASSSAFATSAFWTGNKEQLQSKKVETNKEQPQSAKGEANKEQPQSEKSETKWKCEYRVAYTTQMMLVWRTFTDGCPAEIELEVDGD